MLIFQNNEYEDFCKFAEEQYKKQEYQSNIFLSAAKFSDVYFYVSMLMNIQSHSINEFHFFMMALERARLDIGREHVEYHNKAISLFEVIAKNNIYIPMDILLLTFTGVTYLMDSFKIPKYS